MSCTTIGGHEIVSLQVSAISILILKFLRVKFQLVGQDRKPFFLALKDVGFLLATPLFVIHKPKQVDNDTQANFYRLNKVSFRMPLLQRDTFSWMYNKTSPESGIAYLYAFFTWVRVGCPWLAQCVKYRTESKQSPFHISETRPIYNWRKTIYYSTEDNPTSYELRCLQYSQCTRVQITLVQSLHFLPVLSSRHQLRNSFVFNVFLLTFCLSSASCSLQRLLYYDSTALISV